MKTRTFVSIIIAGVLASSIAQADSTFSIDVIYSGLNPSFTRDVDVSSYYKAPPQLQQAEHKPTCNLRAVVVKNDLGAVQALYPNEPTITNYFAQSSTQFVC